MAKNLKHHLNTLREKPEHVRRRVAVGTSVGITALVAVVWAGTLAATGALAVGGGLGTSGSEGSGVEKRESDFALSGTNINSNFSQLLGAVSEATKGTSSAPALRVIDGDTSSSFEQAKRPANQNNTNATVIAF